MAFLQFDVDVFDVVRGVSTASGVEEAHIAWGLVNLWRRCVREKSNTVRAADVTAAFGPNAEVLTKWLCKLGLLESFDGGNFRIKGVSWKTGAQRRGGD
jgi:hypothetical protein